MPQNLSAQFVCPSPKVLDFTEKSLHQASVVRDPKCVLAIQKAQEDCSFSSSAYFFFSTKRKLFVMFDTFDDNSLSPILFRLFKFIGDLGKFYMHLTLWLGLNYYSSKMWRHRQQQISHEINNWVPILGAVLELPAKGGFFSESAMCLSNVQKKLLRKTILDLKFKFPVNFSILLLVGNINFKFRIVFLEYFF